MRNTNTTTTYSNFRLIHDVIISTALIRSRIALDKFRNRLFRYLDTKSRNLDNLAANRIASMNISQYALFRDVTGLKFDASTADAMFQPGSSLPPAGAISLKRDYENEKVK